MRALQRSCGRECVDWAVGLLEHGYDSRSLRILAVQDEPFNHFELAALRDRVLSELSLPELDNADPVTSYVREVLAGVLSDRKQLGSVFREVSELAIQLGYPSELQPFYLLRFAWEDLQEQEMQWYWPGADRGNIEDIMMGEANRFLAGVPSN